MTIKERISDILSSSEQLNELERQYRISLPEDYKQFLITVNGGRPVERKFSFEENGRHTRAAVAWFFGDCDNANYGLRPNFKIYKGRIPDAFFPIATDSFGNLILLSSRSEDRGSVYFWDHEKEDEDAPSSKNTYLVANSFSEFVQKLH
jgi:hypothetical protein